MSPTAAGPALSGRLFATTCRNCRFQLSSSAIKRAEISPSKNGIASRRYISAPYGYTQAKALVYSKYGEPKDVLSLHSHSISPAYSNQVTIRFLASPINPADINQIQGVYPSKPALSQAIGTAVPSAVGGNEGVAEVVAAGSGVKSVRRGDWVIMKKTGFGTWRTHAQTDEANLFKIEDKQDLTPLQAGTVSVNPCTAYRMLKDFVPLQPGDWFIQNGANSGVGRAAIQLGRSWGLKSINVIRDRPGGGVEQMKQDLLDLGADQVVTDTELMERGFSDRVKEWTNAGREKLGLGLNCVGGKNATAVAKVLSPGAHLVTYGAMSKQPVQLPTGLLIFKNISFDGFWVSKWSDAHPDEKYKTVQDILHLTRTGQFKDVPFQEVNWDWDTPLDTLKEAVQGTLEGFRQGKGVFVFGET
ncbi:NAD(P)-binding protein [Xylona heveae TC161]|uniref:enoyl-[acyl-carrier-protein] reductase n=1 Tax=Xylona heveae (strain CBS 132557 / TC161) TaxID=1328760 RepID=A0A165GWR4_XYLHT|nr:NAD(P)-binding protein [Xylona heveae TC161]KZF22697.1 NAD(P)-binding protein [Xylona heveae TC161]